MSGSTRFRSAWALGIFVPVLFFLLSGSPVLSAVEGQFLAFSKLFVAPVANRHHVAVVSLENDTSPETLSALMARLAPARAIGLVPPFPRAILNGAQMPSRGSLVQGAVRRKSMQPLGAIPPGLSTLQQTQGQTIVPHAFTPGLITGSPLALHRVEMDLLPIVPSDVAVLGFEPGPATIYRAPLVVQGVGDTLLPSFAFRLALLASGENIRSLKVDGIQISRGIIPTDAAYRMYPRPMSADVTVVTATDVLAGRFNARGRTVLIGLVDSPMVEPVAFTGGRTESPVLAEANITAALLARAAYQVPEWGVWAQLGAGFVVAILLAIVLPKLAAATGFVLALLFAFIALAVETGLLMSAIFLPLTAPVLALLMGNLALIFRKRSEARLLALSHELASANRLLGQAYQAQGQLDGALERYRSCPADDDLNERLYTLGLDFERRRQFGKAAATFAFLLEHSPKFRDAAERLQRNREADGQLVFGKTNTTAPTGTVIISDSGLARPVLGRYEVERELGRGAMGAVYLGRDPKIGRTVAIKTMALAQEFDGESLTAVRARFFREAETAGRLAHPNIVTIYDVGEEQELAYIAMDYLKGESLASFCKPKTLLPFTEVMTIGIQVAEALAYAHSKRVVHRDIKPANMVYDRKEGVVKVTDFGVACLTDNSKTRTGTVLGSPSYMSPEQVAGRKVDGRADLFSLGATLFQLLTGELPFKGDSLASLMYQIANEKPADIRKLRRNLPACAGRIITKALQKDPDGRYQDGNEMAAALRRCRDGAKED